MDAGRKFNPKRGCERSEASANRFGGIDGTHDFGGRPRFWPLSYVGLYGLRRRGGRETCNASTGATSGR